MAGARVHHQPEPGKARIRSAELHSGGPRRSRSVAHGLASRQRRIFGRHRGRRYRPHPDHSPQRVEDFVRRRSHRAHGSPETGGSSDSPAIPLDLRYSASCMENRDAVGKPRYGTLGWIAIPNIFLFQIILPLVSPVIDLLFILSIALWGLAQLRIARLPQLWTLQDVERSLVFFAIFMLIDLLTCVVAFALEKNEDWTLLAPLILQRFYYRQMMYVVLFRALKEAVQGRPVGWRGVEPQMPAPVVQS